MDCEGKPGETAGPAALTREILGEPKNYFFFFTLIPSFKDSAAMP